MNVAAVSLESLTVCKPAKRQSEPAGSWGGDYAAVCSLCEAETGHLIGVLSCGMAVWNADL